jgi:hypothetical protein
MGVDLVPTVQGGRIVLEMGRSSVKCDPTIGLDPVVLDAGQHFSGRFTNHRLSTQTGETFKGGVDLEVPVIDRLSVDTANDFVEGKSFGR